MSNQNTFGNNRNTLSNSSIIGKGTLIKGKIRCKSDIRIDGTIEGELSCEGKIFVGTDSVSKVNIDTSELTIDGSMIGDIVVHKNLTVGNKGRIKGNVETPHLVVESGGIINGQVTMEEKT